MAVLQVTKWDVRPEMTAAYVEWALANAQIQLGIPGVIELRAFRPIAGSSQVVSTAEFADLATYAAWRSHPENERILAEAHKYVENLSVELWGPSPAAPAPLRPE